MQRFTTSTTRTYTKTGEIRLPVEEGRSMTSHGRVSQSMSESVSSAGVQTLEFLSMMMALGEAVAGSGTAALVMELLVLVLLPVSTGTL